MNIIKHRYLYFTISLLVILPGMIALALWGLPLGIDFTGGSLLEISFSGARPESALIAETYAEFGIEDAIIQPLGDDAFSIRTAAIDDATKGKIVSALEEKTGQTVTVMHFTQVSPAVGAEVAARAMGAVALAALFILGYITYAFRGVQHAFRYGVAAITAMLHDVLVVVGLEAIFGHFLGWQADSLFLTALLTVIGFSVHDSIVVFDRVRENSHIYRRLDYETLVNHSIVQTLDRSINTQLTVLFTLLALALFGGSNIRHFVIILMVGIFSGTYSSIFNAAPILVVWENQEWKNWFRRGGQSAA